jgi:hypothetical protein
MQQLFGGSEYYEPNSSSRGDSDEVITSPKKLFSVKIFIANTFFPQIWQFAGAWRGYN